MNPYRLIPPPGGSDPRPTKAEIRRLFPDLPEDMEIHTADTCSENSILTLVGKTPLLQDIHRAAQGSGCRVKIIDASPSLFLMPALLAVIDPTLVEADDWDKVCEVFQDAGPENAAADAKHNHCAPVEDAVEDVAQIPLPGTSRAFGRGQKRF